MLKYVHLYDVVEDFDSAEIDAT